MNAVQSWLNRVQTIEESQFSEVFGLEDITSNYVAFGESYIFQRDEASMYTLQCRICSRIISMPYSKHLWSPRKPDLN